MEIREEHRLLLKGMGLTEEDFELFDGQSVTYEYDERKGVRLYDPDYRTSYNEYIDIDGWSSWNREGDTFMTDMLKETLETVAEREKTGPGPDRDAISRALQKKFGKTD
jgi:hypothetical protein